MANCIVLYKPSEPKNSDGNINPKPGITKRYNQNNTKFYKNNPFVRLTEYPVFLHNEISNELKLESIPISLETRKISPNNNLNTIITDNDNKKKMIYFLGKNDNIQIDLGPTMYNPMNFEPVKCELIRMASVNLSDKEIERLIINNRYYSELITSENKLFYFDMVDDNFDTEMVSFKLMERTNDILNDEEYSIYAELIKRLSFPRSKKILDDWINQIKGDNPITNQNKNYMYTLIGRNAKYTR